MRIRWKQRALDAEAELEKLRKEAAGLSAQTEERGREHRPGTLTIGQRKLLRDPGSGRSALGRKVYRTAAEGAKAMQDGTHPFCTKSAPDPGPAGGTRADPFIQVSDRRARQYDGVVCYGQGPPPPGQPDVFKHRTPEGFPVITSKKDVTDAVARSGGRLKYSSDF